MKPFLVLAFVAVTLAAVSASVDIKKWRKTFKHDKFNKEGEMHVLDKFDGPAKGCSVVEMTDAERVYVTKVHNDLRSKVANGQERRGVPGPQPKAKNMAKLTYDPTLEKLAMAWASQCEVGHDKHRLVAGYKSIGQNFFMEGSSIPLEKLDWKRVTTAWYDEVKDMNGTAATEPWIGGNPAVKGDVGHYAQIIRAETKKLGCCAVNFRDGEWYMRHAICDYADGVHLRVPLYDSGKPCSADPKRKCENGLIA